MTQVDDHRATALRRRLADELAQSGDLRSPEWRTAVESVPRHVFIPNFFRWVDTPRETKWEPISPGRVGVEEWLELAYTNETWVTQLDRGTHPTDVDEPVPGNPTSSSSLPGLVVSMLEELHVSDDMLALEIGTGTGYSTALMSHRLGGDRVTSIEVDEAVARSAAAAIHQAGYEPALVTGEGLDGHAERGPYDRIIATCSVRHIPPAWLAQSRVGGKILTTLRGWLGASSGLIRLDVTGDQTAEGNFLPGTISFMPARRHDHAPLDSVIPSWIRRDGPERRTSVDPEIIIDPWKWTPMFLAQLAAPTGQHLCFSVDGGPLNDYLIDIEHQAVVAFTPQPDGSYTVRQAGPVALWDAVEEAITAWRAAGEPDIDQFRISVTPQAQTVWYDDPRGPLSWTLPTP